MGDGTVAANGGVLSGGLRISSLITVRIAFVGAARDAIVTAFAGGGTPAGATAASRVSDAADAEDVIVDELGCLWRAA